MATRKIFANQEFQPSASLVNPKVHVITDLSQHSGSVGQLVTYSANLYFHDGSNWFTLIESNYSGNLTGAPNFDPSSGNVPFTVGSGHTGRVDNLNADYLDGYDTSTTATSSAIPVYGTSGVLNVGTPTSNTHAATKLYVDNAIQGLDIKPSVAAATTASITLSGNQTIDGVSITAGMRVLVKDQSTASENGIYVSSASAWALAEDSDSQSLSDGAYVFVENGTTHNNTGWTYVNDGAYTWVQFSGAGQITAGDGLTKTGDTLNASVASPLSISNDQITIADGAISGVKLDSGIAGDGLAFTTGVLSVNVSGPLSIAADTLTIADGAIGGAKLNTAIAGDGLGISAGVLSVNTAGPISIVNDDLTIADGAITGAKLNSAIAGNGIGYGSGIISVNVAGPISIVNDLVTIQDGALTGAKLADDTVTSTQLANSITVTDLLVQDVSLATLIVGSTGGAGAELILDGAANGDGSGGDFAYIKMTSGDDLHIVNQQTAGTMLFATGSVTRATIAADGKVKLFQNTGIGGDPSSTYTLYAYGDSKIGGTLEVSTPTANAHAATKSYVDSQVSAATPSVALPISYNASSEITIADQAITGAKLANNTVTSTQLADTIQVSSLGVGVSPSLPLDVYSSSGGCVVQFSANLSNAYEGSILKLKGGNLATNKIMLGDVSDEDIGAINYANNGNTMTFDVNASTRLTIESDGDVKVHERLGVGGTPVSVLSLVSGSRTLDFELKDTPASGDQGIQLIGGSGDSIGIAAGGTGPGLVLDTSNRLGIRTDSMSTQDSTADDLVVGDGLGHYGLTIYSAATYKGTLAFGDPNSNYQGAIVYDHNNDSLALYTGGTSRLSIDSSGNASITGGLSFPDSSKIKLGSGDDLQIYHDGSNGYIDNNTGQLFINKNGPSNAWTCGGEVGFLNAAGTEYLVRATSNGSVKLYYDDSRKFETSSTGVSVTGSAYIQGVLSITGDGSNAVTFTESGAGLMTIATADDLVIDAAGDIRLDADGGDVRLNDNGVNIGRLGLENGDLNIASEQQDYDVRIKGNDGGSIITALHFDMSDAGTAIFNNKVGIGASPDTILDIKSADPILTIEDSSASSFATTNTRINFDISYATVGYIQQSGETLRIASTGGSSFIQLSTAGSDRVTINNAGHVSINATPSSSYKLYVNGNTHIDATYSNPTLLLGRANGYPTVKAVDVNGGHLILEAATNSGTTFINNYVSANVAIASGGGDVGIGSTNATGFKLFVNDSSTAVAKFQGTTNAYCDFTDGTINYRVQVSGDAYIGTTTNHKLHFKTNGSTRATIDTSGYVGLSNTNPQALLHVGSGNFPNPGSGYDQAHFGGLSFLFRNNRDVYLTSNSYFATTGWLTKYNGYAPLRHVMLDGRYEWHIGSGTTAGSGSGFTEYMRLTSTGLGIGVDPSGASLDVKSNIIVRDTDSNDEHIQLFSNGTEGVMRLRNGANWGFIARGSGNNPYIGAYSGGSLNIVGFTSSNGSSFNSTLAQFDFTNQRVGIAAANPSYTLDVAGDASFAGSGSSGYVYVRGNSGSGGSTTPLYRQGMIFGYNRSNGQGESNLIFTNAGGGNNVRLAFQYWNNSTLSEFLTVSSQGFVGIGDVSPTKHFSVQGTLTYDASTRLLKISNSGNAGGIDITNANGRLYMGGVRALEGSGTSTLFLGEGFDAVRVLKSVHMATTSGSVGIGTTSPSAKLEISSDGGSSQNTVLIIKSDDPNGDQTGSSTADIDFYIWDSNTRLTTPQARIGIVGGEIASQNIEAAGRLAFYTSVANYGSPGLVERMRIDPDGNVAIGNQNAWSRLWVERDGIDLNNDWSFEDASSVAHLTLAGQNSHVRLHFGTMDVSPYGGYIQAGYDNTPDDSGTGSSGVEPILLNPKGGNVGIGLTGSPDEKLHVAGNIRVGVGGASDYNQIEFTRNGGAVVGGMGWDNSGYFYVAGHPDLGPTAGNIVRVYGFGSDLRFGNSAWGDVLTIDDSNGYVGVGTINAGAKLHVVQTGTGEAFRIDGANSGFAMIVEGGTSYKTRMRGGVTIGNSYGSATPPSNGLLVEGYTGIGVEIPQDKLDVDGTVRCKAPTTSDWGLLSYNSSGNAPSGVWYTNSNAMFLARTSSDALTVRLESAGTSYIDNNFNFGIGTQNPDYKLDVRDGSAATRIVVRNENNAGGGAGIYMRTFNGTTQVSNATVRTNNTGIFSIFNGAGTESENFSISAAGDTQVHNKLGIGTASPSYKLDVAGSFHAKDGSSAIAFNEYNSGATLWLDGADGDFTGGDYYNISANNIGQLTFGIGGSAAVTLNSSSNLGIGVAPTNARLTVDGDGSSGGYSGTLRIHNTAYAPWASIGFPDNVTSQSNANNYYLIGRGGNHSHRALSFHIPNASDYGDTTQPKFLFASTGAVALCTIDAATGDTYIKGNTGIGVAGTTHKLHVNGNSLVSGNTYIGDSNRYFALRSNGMVRLQSPYGYVEFGPDNTLFSHFQTDRNRFYFNKSISVDSGSIQSYDEDLALNASQAGGNKKILFQSGGASYAAMDATGKWGLGTVSPSYQLHVAGDAYASSGFITAETTSGGYRYRTNNSWGGWSRPALTMQDGSGNQLYSIGGYGGNGTTLGYGWIGRDYADHCIRWYLDGGVYLTHNDVDKLHVDANGAVVSGRLDVSGNADVGGTLDVSGNADVGGTLDVSAISVNGTTTANRYLGTNSSGTLEWKTASSNPYITNISMGGFVVSQNKDWVNVNTTLTYNTGATISDSATIVMTTLNCPDDCATGS